MINSKSNRSNTGFKGITLRKRAGRNDKFQTQVHINLKQEKAKIIHVGNFDTLEDALIGREQFIKNLF